MYDILFTVQDNTKYPIYRIMVLAHSTKTVDKKKTIKMNNESDFDNNNQ